MFQGAFCAGSHYCYQKRLSGMYKLLEWQLNRLARNLSKLDLEINVSILRKGYSHNAAQVFFFFRAKDQWFIITPPPKKSPQNPKTTKLETAVKRFQQVRF